MREAPLTMVVPLLIVAAGLFGFGLYTGDIVTHVIAPIIPAAILH
jgi:multicomponent Na+:H+ antiporter subunit D